MQRRGFQLLLDAAQREYAPIVELWNSSAGVRHDVLHSALRSELERQAMINLVASESRPSTSIMLASAFPGYTQTVEGLAGRRWYPGSNGIDEIEELANESAQKVFGYSGGNVQPHSATGAIQAVYLAALKPGDTILAPAFLSGGHLSHGAKNSLAHQLYKIETYSVPSFESSFLLEDIERKIRTLKPSLVIGGFSAYPREFPFAEVASIVKDVGSCFMADISHSAGLVAAGIHAPVSSSQFCVFSTHKTLCGPRAGVVLCESENQRRIDIAVFPAIQGALFPNMMAAKALCLAQASSVEFRDLQRTIVQNARALAAVFSSERIPMFTGGTDSHLLLIQMDPNRDSKRDVARLERVGILTNANYVHGDSLRSGIMSGIRMGTTWISQLGFKPRQVTQLGHVVVETLQSNGDQDGPLRRRLEKIVEDALNNSTR